MLYRLPDTGICRALPAPILGREHPDFTMSHEYVVPVGLSLSTPNLPTSIIPTNIA